jgi:DNA-binding NarL/FixJ family response regulator
VLVAVDPAAALRICALYRGNVDLFVCQCSVGSALETARALRRARPEVRVVIAVADDSETAFPFPILRRPIRQAALQSAIEAALDLGQSHWSPQKLDAHFASLLPAI